MDSRRVIKLGDSYYINIPQKVSEALDIIKSERLNVAYISGVGIFITRPKETNNLPANPESIERLRKATAEILSRQEKKLKSLADDFISKFMLRLVPTMATSGVFELRKDVSKIERQVEKLERGERKLSLVRHHKKSSR